MSKYCLVFRLFNLRFHWRFIEWFLKLVEKTLVFFGKNDQKVNKIVSFLEKQPTFCEKQPFFWKNREKRSSYRGVFGVEIGVIRITKCYFWPPCCVTSTRDLCSEGVSFWNLLIVYYIVKIYILYILYLYMYIIIESRYLCYRFLKF